MKLKGIDFKPRATKEDIQRGKDWLVKNKASFTGMANFAVLSNIANTPSHSVFGGPCHSAIAHANISGRVVVATEVGWSRKRPLFEKARELVLPFMKYVLNESYMAEFILNRDDLDFCLDYGFVISTDVYAPILQNICITSRMFYEQNPGCFKLFNELVEKGTNPDLAFVVAFGSHIGNYSDENAVTSYAGHRPTNLMPLQDLKNFLTGTPGETSREAINDKSCHYTNRLNYQGGLVLFQDALPKTTGPYKAPHHLVNDLFDIEEFRQTLADWRKSITQSEMYRPPNPFVKSPVKPVSAGMVSGGEFKAFVLPWLQDYLAKDVCS